MQIPTTASAQFGRPATTRKHLLLLTAELWRTRKFEVTTNTMKFVRAAAELSERTAQPRTSGQLRSALRRWSPNEKLSGLLWQILEEDLPSGRVEMSDDDAARLLRDLARHHPAMNALQALFASAAAVDDQATVLHLCTDIVASLTSRRAGATAGVVHEPAHCLAGAYLASDVCRLVVDRLGLGAAPALVERAAYEVVEWSGLWQRSRVSGASVHDIVFGQPAVLRHARVRPPERFDTDAHQLSWHGLVASAQLQRRPDLQAGLQAAARAARGTPLATGWESSTVLAEAGLALLDLERRVEARLALDRARHTDRPDARAIARLAIRLGLHAICDGRADEARELLRAVAWDPPDDVSDEELDYWIDERDHRHVPDRDLLSALLDNPEPTLPHLTEAWLHRCLGHHNTVFTRLESAALLGWALRAAEQSSAIRVVAACTLALTAAQPRTALDKRLAVDLARLDRTVPQARAPRIIGKDAVRAVQAALLSGALDVDAVRELELTLSFLHKTSGSYPR